MAISVFNGWSLRNLDIITAFLNGDVDAEVYMETRDLGNPKLFLGIQIERRKDKLIIHQRNYIRRLLERLNALENPVATPL